MVPSLVVSGILVFAGVASDAISSFGLGLIYQIGCVRPALSTVFLTQRRAQVAYLRDSQHLLFWEVDRGKHGAYPRVHRLHSHTGELVCMLASIH
jgi:hypothetical protein